MTYKQARNEQGLREILVLSLYRKTKNLEDAERLDELLCEALGIDDGEPPMFLADAFIGIR
jgi:hypothetical protein